MADIKKFLDQAGVSTLWSKVAEEVGKVDTKVTGLDERLETAEGKIDALEKGTYDDTEVRNLIAGNTTAIQDNDADILAINTKIDTLNGSAETAGSVANTATTIAAAKVAEIVAGADAKYDTLKEIADWILNDTTGAADMANDIAALQALVGDTAVATQISNAIDTALKVDGVDKYALASDLTALADRVKALEDAGYQDATQVGNAIDTKIAALNLANTYEAKGAAATAEANAKAYADGLAPNYATAAQGTKADSALQAADVVTGTANGSISVKGTDVAVKGLGSAAYTESSAYDVAGAAENAFTAAKNYSDANLGAAKTYTDDEIAKVQALTEAEILAAINGTTNA